MSKTERWVIFSAQEKELNLHCNMSIDVAVPASWIAKGATMALEPTTEAEARDGTEADFVVGPGLMASPDSMDEVYMWASTVYTLVDAGYIDGDKAVLAFREAEEEEDAPCHACGELLHLHTEALGDPVGGWICAACFTAYNKELKEVPSE